MGSWGNGTEKSSGEGNPTWCTARAVSSGRLRCAWATSVSGSGMAFRLRFCSRACATSNRPRADVWFRSQTTDLGRVGLQLGSELSKAPPNPRALSIRPYSAPPLSPVTPSMPRPPHWSHPSDPAHRSLVLTRSALASILAPASPMALPLISNTVRLGLVARARSSTLAPSFSLDSATDRDCRGWG